MRSLMTSASDPYAGGFEDSDRCFFAAPERVHVSSHTCESSTLGALLPCRPTRQSVGVVNTGHSPFGFVFVGDKPGHPTASPGDVLALIFVFRLVTARRNRE